MASAERRARLGDARLMLIFTPAVAPDEGAALGALEAALPHVDVVQVRPKGADQPVGFARETLTWTERVVELAGGRALVLVNDRVDVALALGEGVDGVHLGADDAPPRLARELLGPDAIVGLSTHDARQVARAADEPVDYLGFGPIFPTETKGYARGLGAETAWVAAGAAVVPLFPIGGIDLQRVADLAPVGRAAVSAAILAADDPGDAARLLRAALVPDHGRSSIASP